MVSHDNTWEEATSARAIRSAADRASEVKVIGYDTAHLLHAPLMLYGVPRPRLILLQLHVYRMTWPYPEGRQGEHDATYTESLLEVVQQPGTYSPRSRTHSLPLGLGPPVVTAKAFLGLAQEIVSSFSGSNATALRLVHRHGPCSPFHNKKLLSLEETLLKDQLRVNYLRRSALKSSTKSQVDDSEASIPAEYGGGEYVITVGYGTPSREQTVTMDTGSDLSWIQCKPCSACYSQQQPIFDPSQSSSYATIPCNSPDCSQLRSSCSSSCAYGITYGDGSITSGVYSHDRLMLSPNDVIEDFLFGCGTDNEGLFQDTAGLVGLGRGKRSLVSQTSQVYHSVFSYCLPSTPSSTGFLKLGEPGDASNTVYTRMQTSSNHPSFYFVDLTGISVGGQQLAISPSVFSWHDRRLRHHHHSPPGVGIRSPEVGVPELHVPVPYCASDASTRYLL
ncbi:hypothetical protein B296_00042651 [Ensete ventricosum]|uniref:Peptidase A1 domain-containing protein n=1 Tax=Ensete ventricosum TaxID=4639 RepID=A0A426ZBE1_ENSVE|nr:hypothetical protein B296_00042651 [Ensete ventricosum]